MRPSGPPQQGTKSITAERERIVELARQAQRQAQQTVAEELLLSLPTKYDLERTGGGNRKIMKKKENTSDKAITNNSLPQIVLLIYPDHTVSHSKNLSLHKCY